MYILVSSFLIALPSFMPTIEVVARYTSPQDHCGQARIISCIVNLVDNLSTLPSISWVGPDGCRLPDIKTNNPVLRQLLLNSTIPTNKGVYKCLVSINIPEAFIEGHVEETSVTVNTLCELMYLSIMYWQSLELCF